MIDAIAADLSVSIGDKVDATLAFIKNWWLQWGEQEVGTSQLYECATTCSPKVDLGTGSETSKRAKLGMMVRDLKGEEFLIDIDENTKFKVRVIFVKELNNAKR
jgi:hypothetical protein